MQTPRQLYGLGSFVKKLTKKVTRPVTKIAKKIVPKEIAGIMRTAAPFLPAGYREAAYLLGTAKQTGRISPMDLALTAAPTFFSKTDMGRGIAQRVGDFTLPGMERNLRQIAVGSPAVPGTDVPLVSRPGEFMNAPLTGKTATLGAKEATSGIFGKGGKFFQFGKGGPKILDTKAGEFLLGGKEAGTFSPSKVAGLGVGVLSLVSSAKTPQEAGEALANQTGNSDDYERGAQLFSQLKPELFEVPEQFRMPVKDGGRIGFRQGTPKRGLGSMGPDMAADPRAGLGALGDMKDREFKFDAQEFMINKYKEDGTKPKILGEGMMGNEKMFVIETPNFGTMAITLDQYLENFGIPEREIRNLDEDFGNKNFGIIINTNEGPKKITKKDGGLMRTNFAMGSDDDPKPLPEDPTKPINPFGPKPIKPLGDMKMAGLDRKEKAQMLADELAEEEFGMDFYDLDIRTQMKIYQIALDMIDEGGNAMGGLPNDRTNFALGTRPTAQESGLGGLPIEADMRYTGGFMPYGAKEKADDVPARLSKNEFVFTADAVRAAGGGSVQKGAQKMYNTMKQLEAKPEAKGMMA